MTRVYQIINDKIREHPELEQYRPLFEYKWDEYDEFIDWVGYASITEIIEWAEEVIHQGEIVKTRGLNG